MKVLFVSSSRKGKGLSPFVLAQGESLRCTGVVIDFYLIPGQGLTGYFSGLVELRKKVRVNSYNIVHAHFGISAIVAKLAFPFKPKIVVSFLGDDLEGSVNENGKYTWFSKIIVLINKFFAKFFYHYIIVKSDNHSKKLNCIKNKTILPNGVNLNIFHPINKLDARKQLNLKSDKFYLFFAANPKRSVKNFQLLREAEKQSDQKYIILYPESLTPAQMNLFYNASDVVVLTSHHEGSPNVIKEAMACCRPIVSTEVGDIKWLFGNIPGHYVAAKDAKNLSAKIDEALTFSIDHFSTLGRQRLIDLQLDQLSVAAKLIEIYNRVLKS